MSMILALSDTHLTGPRVVFRWNEIANIPPNDIEEKLLRNFLIDEFGANWIRAAKITKSAGGMVININTPEKSLLLTLNKEKTEMKFVLDGQTIRLKASEEYQVINIYDINYYPKQLRSLVKTADLVLHAGDFVCQGAYDDLLRLCKDAKCELWALRGNNACSHPNHLNETAIHDEHGVQLPGEKADVRFGVKIGLMHKANGDLYDFSESLSAENAAKMKMPNEAAGVDVLVFGHLHEPIVVWNKKTNTKRRLLVCPGPGSSNAIDYSHKCSPSPTVALLYIENGDISSAKIECISWD
jgi:predicted phosphodiesterase